MFETIVEQGRLFHNDDGDVAEHLIAPVAKFLTSRRNAQESEYNHIKTT
jgi:hypothetical protein